MVDIPRGKPSKEHKDLGEAMNGPAFPKKQEPKKEPEKK